MATAEEILQRTKQNLWSSADARDRRRKKRISEPLEFLPQDEGGCRGSEVLCKVRCLAKANLGPVQYARVASRQRLCNGSTSEEAQRETSATTANQGSPLRRDPIWHIWDPQIRTECFSWSKCDDHAPLFLKSRMRKLEKSPPASSFARKYRFFRFVSFQSSLYHLRFGIRLHLQLCARSYTSSMNSAYSSVFHPRHKNNSGQFLS